MNLYSAYKFSGVTKRFGRQINEISDIVGTGLKHRSRASNFRWGAGVPSAEESGLIWVKLFGGRGD